MTLVVTDAERRRSLRRMKAGAGLLLLGAALVFAATYAADDGGGGWVGFVRAAAEAAMVGGLADWFAVTALFRHPLGLPVPHTALIPRRKDAIGESLAGFVQDHFLSVAVITGRLRDLRVVPRVAGWLAVRTNARRVTTRVAGLLRLGLAEVRGDGLHSSEVSRVVARVATERLAATSWASLAGRLLASLVAADRHRPAVDLMVTSTRTWLGNNRALVLHNLRKVAPGWVPWFVKDPALEAVYDKSVRLADEVAADPRHELRASLDALVQDYARDLQRGGGVAARFDEMVRTALRHPETGETLADLLDRGLRMLAELADEPDGPLQALLTERLVDLGGRIAADPALAARLEGALERLAVTVTQEYAGEFTRLVTDTVARWDGAETAQRIELQVGRDLQFIRINGTVVGALAGLVIHAVALLLGG